MVAREQLSTASEPVRALLVGDPGSGKTTAAAAMAKLGKIVFFAAEAGIKRRPLEKLGIPIKNIEVVRTAAYDELDEAFWDIKSDLDSKPGCYKGIVIDSASELVQRFLDVQRKEGYDLAVAKAERRQEEPGITRWFTDRSYYGTMSGQFRELLRHFVDLDCHFCLTALPRRDVDDDGRVKYGPGVNPALQGDLMGYMDVVGFTDSEDGVYTSIFQPSRTKQAKDRFGALPSPMVDPFFDRIVGYIEDKITAASDPVQRKLDGDVETAEAQSRPAPKRAPKA